MKKVGIDIVENERIQKNLSRERFVSLVLSENERKLYMEMDENRRVEFVAGRFACKEAIIKALCDDEVPVMNQLDIYYGKNKEPLISYKDYNLLISLSHEKNYSVAIAILE